MFKNQTPRQLSLYIAILSSAAIALLTLSLKVVGLLRILWSEMALLFVVASLVAFIVNYYLIRYYIFRRIKLIYKILYFQHIHLSKFLQNQILKNIEYVDDFCLIYNLH